MHLTQDHVRVAISQKRLQQKIDKDAVDELTGMEVKLQEIITEMRAAEQSPERSTLVSDLEDAKSKIATAYGSLTG